MELRTGFRIVNPAATPLGEALAAAAWNEVRPYVGRAAQRLRAAVESHAKAPRGAQPRGAQLDRRALYRAPIDGAIFQRRSGSTRAPSGALAVALDDSGSMWTTLRGVSRNLTLDQSRALDPHRLNGGTRHGHARLAASLLLQAGARARIAVGAYGHSCWGDRPPYGLAAGRLSYAHAGGDHAPSTVRAYCPLGNAPSATSLAGYLASDGNDTWAHAAEAVRALLAAPVTHRVLVVVSDGGFLGPPPGGWTRWLTAVIRAGVAVLPIAIGGAQANALPGVVQVDDVARLADVALARVKFLLRAAR